MSPKWRGLELPKKLTWDEDTQSPIYGKLIAEPLERGYGVTVGNSLRRVLSSSLEGSAVTSVRIEGVLHEFATIRGVREDVTEIILNLKQLLVRVHGGKPRTLRVRAKGQGEVRAAHIIKDSQVVLEYSISTQLDKMTLDKEMFPHNANCGGFWLKVIELMFEKRKLITGFILRRQYTDN